MKMKSLANTSRFIRIMSLVVFFGMVGTNIYAGEYRVEGDMSVEGSLNVADNKISFGNTAPGGLLTIMNTGSGHDNVKLLSFAENDVHVDESQSSHRKLKVG